MMKAGIVGLPNVGKTALFNALTSAGIELSNYAFSTTKPNVATVNVPDPRLEELGKYVPTKKTVPAQIEVVDIAGLVKGSSKGDGLGNQFLSHIRQVDAILHIVRCFEDPNVMHVESTIDPVRDAEIVELELVFADTDILQKTKDKHEKKLRLNDKEAAKIVALADRCIAALNEGKAARTLELNEEERRHLSGLGIISAKPVLFIANVGENDIEGKNPMVESLRNYAKSIGARVVPISARIEAEIVELSDAEKQEMLQGLGIKEAALPVLIREAYAMLGLQSYFTAGEKENKAWTIPIGATAPQAAGVIHSDFERGFIRAEVFSIDDLRQLKTEAAIRQAGKLRTEGKSYIVKDGDIMHFLFSV